MSRAVLAALPDGIGAAGAAPLGLEALEDLARERLPREVFDFFAGGSGLERTLRDNVEAWGRVRLRPRALRDVREVRPGCDLLGTPLPAPIAIAPMGYQRLAHPEAEAGCARGAAAAGALTIVSTRTSTPVDRVAAAAAGAPLWLQVYVLQDRAWTEEIVGLAVASGYRALVLTADTPVVGPKRRAGGSALPPGDDLWLPHPHARALALPARERHAAGRQSAAVTLEDIGWLARLSGLPVVVKGILRGDDADACLRAGASGIVVSNHGGRQLDGAVASADVLREVVDAVAGRAEVYVDGGIRSGGDVLRALALGARAVLLGRPVLWGLATGGAAGVEAVVRTFVEELRVSMMLAGARSLDEITPDLLA